MRTKSSQYTKGKWKVVHEFNVESENHRVIASCGSFFDNTKSDSTRQENIANAHLISSSPDLYEALKSALVLLDKQREEYNATLTILPHKPIGEGEIAKAARKALAKAENKQ